MTVLGQGLGSGFPTAIDTAEQQVDGASGTLADANWANDVTAALTAIEGALGVSPAGTMATVAARLLTLIAAGGGITAGTTANRPTPATGQYRLYWNTTLNRLEMIKDDLSVTAIVGVTAHSGLTGLGNDDHTIYDKTDGTRTRTGDMVIEKDSPRVHVSGTETSAKKWSLYESAGVLYLQENTGTISAPVWATRWTIPIGTGKLTIAGEDVVGYDTGNSVAVSLKAHASRHRQGAQDPDNYGQFCESTSYTVTGDGNYNEVNRYPVYLASGAKTVNIGAYFRTENISYPVSAKFALVSNLAESASITAQSNSTANFISTAFVCNGSGWQHMLVQVAAQAAQAATISKIYVFTN